MYWFKKAQRRKFNPTDSTVVWKRPSSSRRGNVIGKGSKKHTYIVEFTDKTGKKTQEEIHSRNMEKDWKAKPGSI